jgi:hypothetical protein
MNKFILALAGVMLLAGCKKIIEKKAEDAIMTAMTDGQWVITSFTTNGSDITADYTGYKFQYFRDYTVTAIKNGTVERTGSWQPDAPNMNISANFPNATYPVSLISGTWHITDNSWTYVVANMTVGSEIRTLRLEKQ